MIKTVVLTGVTAVAWTGESLATAVSTGDVGAWLAELGRQAPGLGILAIVVFLFLRHIERAESSRNETLEKMGAQCHAVQDRATAAIDRNTKATEVQAQAAGHLAATIEQFSRRAEEFDRTAERIEHVVARLEQ